MRLFTAGGTACCVQGGGVLLSAEAPRLWNVRLDGTTCRPCVSYSEVILGQPPQFRSIPLNFISRHRLSPKNIGPGFFSLVLSFLAIKRCNRPGLQQTFHRVGALRLLSIVERVLYHPPSQNLTCSTGSNNGNLFLSALSMSIWSCTE